MDDPTDHSDPRPPSTVGALRRLAESLWEQRRVVEMLLHRFTVADLLLRRGASRFAPLTFAEIEDELDRLRLTEQRRIDAVADVVTGLGLPHGRVTLATLARSAPEPFDAILADHHDVLSEAAAEIEHLAGTTRALTAAALDAVHDARHTLIRSRLALVDGTTPTTAGRRASDPALQAPRRPTSGIGAGPDEGIDQLGIDGVWLDEPGIHELGIDEIVYHAALESAGPALPGSLTTFLR